LSDINTITSRDRTGTISGTVPARNNVVSVQSQNIFVPEPEHAEHDSVLEQQRSVRLISNHKYDAEHDVAKSYLESIEIYAAEIQMQNKNMRKVLTALTWMIASKA